MKRFKFKDAILHQDEDLIVLNKPAGISALQERWNAAPSIQDYAEQYDAESQLCHRLDKDTSGVLLIARNPETYRSIAVQFENRMVDKEYWAVVDGRHFFETIDVDLPLGTTSRGKAKVDKRNGKDASTSFRVIETFRHFALVDCRPRTGRLHQIRIHLASLNAPIAMDAVYGGSRPLLSDIKRNFNYSKGKDPKPMILRMALHARSIEITHQNKKATFEAALPKDLNVFIQLLRKYDSIEG